VYPAVDTLATKSIVFVELFPVMVTLLSLESKLKLVKSVRLLPEGTPIESIADPPASLKDAAYILISEPVASKVVHST
jgi:hypothetical protein